MKKRIPHTYPTPTRGTLAQIARELGLTRQAIFIRYYNGNTEVIKRVAEIEADIIKQKRQAVRSLARALGA